MRSHHLALPCERIPFPSEQAQRPPILRRCGNSLNSSSPSSLLLLFCLQPQKILDLATAQIWACPNLSSQLHRTTFLSPFLTHVELTTPALVNLFRQPSSCQPTLLNFDYFFHTPPQLAQVVENVAFRLKSAALIRTHEVKSFF